MRAAQVLRTWSSQPLTRRCGGCRCVNEDEIVVVDVRILDQPSGRASTKHRRITLLAALIAHETVVERTAADRGQRSAFAEQVARAASVGAEADRIQPVRRRDAAE